jgi:hypothetical protein
MDLTSTDSEHGVVEAVRQSTQAKSVVDRLS